MRKMTAAAAAGLHLVRLYQVHVCKNLNQWQDRLAAVFEWLETQNTPVVVYMALGATLYDQHTTDLTAVAPHVKQMVMGADGSLTCIDVPHK